METGDNYSENLEIFDKLEKNSMHKRRTAVKPLYDYFQRILLEVGVKFCGIKPELLKSHLERRWEIIKSYLSYIEEPTDWDSLINKICTLRHGVEHNDYYNPDMRKLLDIREKAPKFKEWVFRVGREYYKKSKHFTIKEVFYHLSSWYISEAESISNEYGKEPYIATLGHSLDMEGDFYPQLPKLVKILKERVNHIIKLEDIIPSDLENLVNLIKIISNIKGREKVLLHYSICPKCGGKIKEITSHFGSTLESPEPEGFYYIVGCERCDYKLHEETIYF